MTINP